MGSQMNSISLLNRAEDYEVYIFLVCLLIPVLLLRHVFEKVQYQTAWSASVGDPLAMGNVLIAHWLLHHGARPPWWLNSLYHEASIAAGLVIGIGWFIRDKPKRWGDRFHHLVIAPIVAYAGFTIMPIVYTSGSPYQMKLGTALIAIYLALAAIDWYSGLIDQVPAMEKRLRFKWPTD